MTDWLGKFTYCEDCVYREDNALKCKGRIGCYDGYSEYNEEEEKLQPVIMQLAEPEFMCEKCGYKFYVYEWDKRPTKCECGVLFDWNIDNPNFIYKNYVKEI